MILLFSKMLMITQNLLFIRYFADGRGIGSTFEAVFTTLRFAMAGIFSLFSGIFLCFLLLFYSLGFSSDFFHFSILWDFPYLFCTFLVPPQETFQFWMHRPDLQLCPTKFPPIMQTRHYTNIPFISIY